MLDLSPASSFELPSRSHTGVVCPPQSKATRVRRRTILQDGDSFTHAGRGWAAPRSQPSLSSFLQRAGSGAARRPQPLVLPARTMPANKRLQQVEA